MLFSLKNSLWFFSGINNLLHKNADLEGHSLIFKLAEGFFEDAYLKKLVVALDKVCREYHLVVHMNFPSEHPVEEAGRVLLALLLKTHRLEAELVRLVEDDAIGETLKPTKGLIDCLKSVHQVRFYLAFLLQLLFYHLNFRPNGVSFVFDKSRANLTKRSVRQ